MLGQQMFKSRNSWKAVITSKDTNPEVVDQLQIFRKKLFVDILRWNLNVIENREIDQFDTRDALYCAVYLNDRLAGGFRAIRGDYPYLAERVFPQFATLRAFPKRADVFEISRFGIDPDCGGANAAMIVYGTMIRFAQARRASSLVALVDLHHERLLRIIGIHTRRYGPPQVVGMDLSNRELTAVAGEIPLSDQRTPEFAKLLNLASTVEMTDETLVLGRAVVSA